MNFISHFYALFLGIILVIYWSVPSRNFKLWILLFSSLLFYLLASQQFLYLILLLLITLGNFFLGQVIGVNTTKGRAMQNPNLSNEDWQRAQTFWNRWRLQFLCLGIVLNVVLLLSFKYLPFILGEPSKNGVSGTGIIFPLGLSFFCFECISYLIDVYRGAPAPQKFVDFAAYKLFFPKLIAGPITRYHHFASEQGTLTLPKLEQLIEGLWLIACGAIKKGLLADNLARIVDLIFGTGNLQRAGSEDLWIAIFAYGLQLYFDFSGYVDIARGSAILLGFNLPQNFDFPYFSTSIAEFWRRWHITLGDWLRNYLYFPLGGSRRGLFRTCLNLLIVMLIAGMWHGSAWGYVVWGGLHGVALIIHRLTEALSKQSDILRNWWRSQTGIAIAWLLTQLMVFTSWIFFRLPNLKDANWVMGNLWGHEADVQFAHKIYGEAIALGRPQISLILIVLIMLMAVVYIFGRGLKLQINWPLKLLLVPLCLYVVWLFAPADALPYIYFDF